MTLLRLVRSFGLRRSIVVQGHIRFVRRSGGWVRSGEPYIVGEKGPELFIPPNTWTE